jgi:hypothetical protein
MTTTVARPQTIVGFGGTERPEDLIVTAYLERS